ncbi:MAG TPA: transposase [Solirubrobacterales bacterium]|nr:transposase [Solirubrobacterales bacterium]
MAASKFTAEITEGLIELVTDGLTIKDAALAMEVREKTVRNWLAKGRGEEDGPHAAFAEAIEEAQQESQSKEEPMDRDELLLVVSKAARKGSVQAMKLMEEMLRAKPDDPGEKPEDPFDTLDSETEDELAAARAKKAS